jgi:hypothetical protein
MWDVLVIKYRTILANRPDIMHHDKKEKTCLPIDTAISDDTNFNTKETDKLSKYKDVEIKLGGMWKVRAEVVPAIIGALGTIKKGLNQNLQLLPGHPSALELQKIPLMTTAHCMQ